jgi:hypothetical protein
VLLLAANRARVLPTIVSRAVEVRIPPPAEDQACALLGSHHSLDADAARRLLAAAAADVAVALHAEAAELPDQADATCPPPSPAASLLCAAPCRDEPAGRSDCLATPHCST